MKNETKSRTVSESARFEASHTPEKTERTTHTPAPWFVYAGTMITSDPAGFCHLASVPESGQTGGRLAFWETRANAKLMAAAPELLEACKLLLKDPHSVKGAALAIDAIIKAEEGSL